ncbi:hypothetical protein ABIF61_007378 [Bradyrhizobium japonicum]
MVFFGYGIRRDDVFVEHAYDIVSGSALQSDETLPFYSDRRPLRTLAAVLRISLTSARCHSVR